MRGRKISITPCAKNQAPRTFLISGMKHSVFVFLLLFATAASAQSWYKGNLHTHSYWSDGDDFPEMIMDWYKSHGYQFVALSDHNTLQEGEKWKLIQKS